MLPLALMLVFCGIVLLTLTLGQISLSGERVEKIGRPKNAFGSITPAIAFVVPIRAKKRKQIQSELISAGYYHSNAIVNFLALRNVALMACIVTVTANLAFDRWPECAIHVIAIGAVVAILIYSLPSLILSSKAKRRSLRIENSLPDALDLVSMSIEGGVPLQKSMNLVANEFCTTHSDLAQELKIIARQSETGSLETAMSQFAERLDLPEVVAWSAMLKQSQRLGVRMVDSMREYADRIRENKKQKSELAGQTATVKLLLPVVLCLAPPVFILLIGPAVLDFKDFINREKNNGSELIQEANDQPRASRTALPLPHEHFASTAL